MRARTEKVIHICKRQPVRLAGIRPSCSIRNMSRTNMTPRMVNTTFDDVSDTKPELQFVAYNKTFLYAHTSHVHFQPDSLHICTASWIQHHATGSLHQEGRDVGPNEVLCNTRCFQTGAAALRVEEVHHPTESHVYKSVDP